MSGYTLDLSIAIATNTTLSEEKAVDSDATLVHCALAGITCPASVDGTDATVEFSRDGGTVWEKVVIDGAPVVAKIASADSNGVRVFAALTPGYHFALGTKFRLRTATAQSANRVFRLVFGKAVGR